MEGEDSPSRSKKRNKSKRPKPQLPLEENSSSSDFLIVDESASSPVSKSKSNPVKSSTPTLSTPTTSAKKRKRRDSASSDEERWLTAIESGKLEDVDDELKKIKPKDPSLMTARQRAMYDRADGTQTSNPSLMSLPTGYKEKVLTAEAIQKAAIKSLKRKQMADEKREKDKKKTMERLLKKQDSKATRAAKSRIAKMNVPLIVYKQNNDISFMAMPEGMDFPLQAKVAPDPPKKQVCIMNCGNLKKYSCSQTGAPLCSFTCYKRNIASRII